MKELRPGLVKALQQKYEAQASEHKMNIEVLLENQVGVAEHGGVLETIDAEMQKLAEAEDKLMMVNAHFASKPAPKVV